MEAVGGWVGFWVVLVVALGVPLAVYHLIVRGLRARRQLKDREKWHASLQQGEHQDSYEEWVVRTGRGGKRWYER